MSRSDNLKALYSNLLEGPTALQAATQQRIHRYARRTKDAELGAGLARRSDTIEEIDDDLAGWAVARVQSAWFSRPGRDKARVTERLGKETRVTVLEVGASTEGLDPDLYRTFAAMNHPRIAMRLLVNASVDPATRAIATRTLGAAYKDLSYTKRHEVLTGVRECDAGSIGSFVEALSDLTTVTRMLGELPQLPDQALRHVYALCRKELAAVIGLEAEVRKNRNRTSYWRTPYHEVIDTVADALEAAGGNVPERTEVENDLRTLLAHFEQRGKAESDIVDRINDALASLGNENAPARARALQAAAAGSIQQINRLLDSWTAESIEIDNHTVKALLTNEHIDVATVVKVVEVMHWRHRPLSGWSATADIRTEILGAYMAATWQTSDEDIEQHSTGRDTAEVWQAIVLAEAANGGTVTNHLLESRHAHPRVLARLPLSVITQPGIPGWMSESAAEYLETNLTAEHEWDGFEILAKKHLGSLEQLVRGAKHATKRSK